LKFFVPCKEAFAVAEVLGGDAGEFVDPRALFEDDLAGGGKREVAEELDRGDALAGLHFAVADRDLDEPRNGVENRLAASGSNLERGAAEAAR
jgi:hypothetical protein